MPEDKERLVYRLTTEKREQIEARMREKGFRKYQHLAEALINEWMNNKRVVEFRPSESTESDFARLRQILDNGTAPEREGIRSHIKALADAVAARNSASSRKPRSR